MSEEIKLTDQNQFLDYRKSQEDNHFIRQGESIDIFSSILTIEVNTTELCNRKCVFCPRHDEKVYPNRNLNMSLTGANLISSNISAIDYKGKISFSGFSENLLNKDFPNIVKIFRQNLLNSKIECNTNGDKLTKELLYKLFDNGLDSLYINLYDGIDQLDHFKEVIPIDLQDNVKYRMHWNPSDHGLILNNRSGTVTWVGINDKEVADLAGTPCYYPFYKLFVDWNGDVLFCSNDWAKEHVVGNIAHDSIRNVWFSPLMKRIRKRLSKGHRTMSPCNKCSVQGTLFGKRSFDILNDFYNKK